MKAARCVTTQHLNLSGVGSLASCGTCGVSAGRLSVSPSRGNLGSRCEAEDDISCYKLHITLMCIISWGLRSGKSPVRPYYLWTTLGADARAACFGAGCCERIDEKNTAHCATLAERTPINAELIVILLRMGNCQNLNVRTQSASGILHNALHHGCRVSSRNMHY